MAMFKDIVPSVDIKQKNLIDVDASTCAPPRKTVVCQYDDGQNKYAQHNDVQNDDFQREYAQNNVFNAQPNGIQVHQSLWRSMHVSKAPSKFVDYIMLSKP